MRIPRPLWLTSVNSRAILSCPVGNGSLSLPVIKKQREHEKPGMVFHRESSSAKRKVVFITREGGTGKAKPHGNNSKRIDEKPEMSSGNPCSTATENKIEINERNIA